MGAGADSEEGDGMWGMHLPTSHFQHVYDEYNFSIILNLFDNNKPYTLKTQNLSTHNQKRTA